MIQSLPSLAALVKEKSDVFELMAPIPQDGVHHYLAWVTRPDDKDLRDAISAVIRKMRDDGILLGGEVSGHMFFAENYYGVDDGILASCKIIELTARATEPLSRIFASIPHLRATPELKAPCADGEKFRVVEQVTQELKRRYETIETDGARILFDGGWGLVRASNTNAYLTLRFEGQTQAAVDEMKRMVYDRLRRYPFVTLPA